MSQLQATPLRILFISVSRIGDTILITPAIRAVARHWPDAKIDVLAHPKRAEILHNLAEISRLGTITKYRAHFKGWSGRKSYDLAFVFNFDESLIRYALRVSRQVVAFKQTNPDLNAALLASVEHPGNRGRHQVDINLSLPAAVGVPATSKALAYATTAAERDWAEDFLAKHAHYPQQKPLIGLQVASFPTKAYRDWPIESFHALGERILERWPSAHFLILGGKEEGHKTAQLAARFKEHATLCAGKLSLRQTAALMDRLDLYIGVDTGPTHIMSALHKPMIVLYHGYLPSSIAKPLDHPCAWIIDHPRAGQCGPEAAMAEIRTEQVWTAVKQALQADCAT